MSKNPDYRGATYVQPDGSVPKPGLTPMGKKMAARKSSGRKLHWSQKRSKKSAGRK